jgi:hypothetical protein
MQWYYESDGQPQGPIPESQLRRLLTEHRINPYNRVWREGMDDWEPLGSLPEFQTVASLGAATGRASAPASPDPGGLTASEPGEDSESERAAVAAPELEHLPPNTPAWENTQYSRGPLCLIRTAIEVLFVPERAFRNLSHDGHWSAPLIYALGGYAVGWLSFFETAFLLAAHDPNVPATMLEKFQQLPKATFLDMIVPSLVLSALLGPILLLFAACSLHGALAITGAARRSLATTYRLTAYLMGSFSLALCILPAAVRLAVFLGRPEQSGYWISDLILVLGIWAMVCTLRGAATAHQTHLLRVFVSLIFVLLTVLIPPLLFLMRIAQMTLMGS